MDANTQSKLMQIYKKSKADKSNSSLLSSKSDKKKNKSRSVTPDKKQLAELDLFLSIAIQKNVTCLSLPIQILEIILYNYFYPFERYNYVRVCKLFMYLIDDTLQYTLNNSMNDNRIHNFELNAYYFHNNFNEFILIQNCVVMDLSNEILRTFNTQQKRFLSYFFMYQSKLALLYKKEILSSKYKKIKKKYERRKKHDLNKTDHENNAHIELLKTHYEILASFVTIVSGCHKVLCGGNAIWFHVSGMDIFSPILYSKYCLISSLSLDRNFINDEILLLFCKSLLFRNVLYSIDSIFYNCNYLKRLDLSHNNNISDIGLNTLFATVGEKCPNLQEIYLSNLSSITNLTCKIIYKFYQIFGDKTNLKMIVLNRNKFIDENGINILNELFKNNVIHIGQTVRFIVSQCRIDQKLLFNNSWDHRIKLEMPKK